MTLKAEDYRISSIRWYDTRHFRDRMFRDVTQGIVNMGKAQHTDQAVAMVSIPEKSENSQEFQLYINCEKAKDFTQEQMAGVLWHELNHILLGHLHNRVTENPVMQNKNIMVMAEEIACNDIVLAHDVDLPLIDDTSADGIYYGEKWLGYNTHEKSMSTEDIYLALIDKLDKYKDQQTSQNDDTPDVDDLEGDSYDNSGDTGDTLQEELMQHLLSAEKGTEDMQGILEVISVPENMAIDDAVEAVCDHLSSLVDKLNVEKQEDTPSGESKSDNPRESSMDSNMSPYSLIDEDISLNLVPVLSKINPDVVEFMSGFVGMNALSPTWRKRPRWSYGLQSPPILPGVSSSREITAGNNAGVDVVLAVDVSPSIPPRIKEKACFVASTIPAHILNVRVVYFSGHAQEVSLEDGSYISVNEVGDQGVGFGTEFDSVNTWVENNCDVSSTYVVMLTDGESTTCSSIPSHVDSWLWVNVVGKPKQKFMKVINKTYKDFGYDIDPDNVFDFSDVIEA